jgi:hypothetical protein
MLKSVVPLQHKMAYLNFGCFVLLIFFLSGGNPGKGFKNERIGQIFNGLAVTVVKRKLFFRV